MRDGCPDPRTGGSGMPGDPVRWMLATSKQRSPVTEIDDVARELILLFRSLKGMHRTALAGAGLRLEMPAVAVLATLDERGRQRASTLADTLHVDLSSISRQVSALEREGWVQRERDPADSRAALLDLTDSGRSVLHEVRDARIAHLARQLPAWTAPELQAFAQQLQRFRLDVIGEPAAAGPPVPPASAAGPSTATTDLSHPQIHDHPALAGKES